MVDSPGLWGRSHTDYPRLAKGRQTHPRLRMPLLNRHISSVCMHMFIMLGEASPSLVFVRGCGLDGLCSGEVALMHLFEHLPLHSLGNTCPNGISTPYKVNIIM